MGVPEVAVRWLLRYAENNSELATLSNVCRSWRANAVAMVLELAQESLDSIKLEGPTSMLLLPSMIKCLLRSSEDDTVSADTFCIAWFDPSGMETRAVPLTANYSDDDDDSEQERQFLDDDAMAQDTSADYMEATALDDDDENKENTCPADQDIKRVLDDLQWAGT